MQSLQWIIGLFALLGALDKITGNHFKIGAEFEKGIASAGTLSLAMIGMMVLSPVIAEVVIPVFGTISNFLHIDPSFVSGLLANDAGGAVLARQISPDTVWCGYHGLIVASMLGVTISFTIPVSLKMIDKQHHKDVLNGILCGIITMPIGCIVGGLIEGCSLFELLMNSIPVLFFSVLVCVGLILNADLCRGIFEVIGNIILVMITIGLAIGVFAYLTGQELIPGQAPIEEAFATVFGIAIMLAGILPMITVITKILHKPLGMLEGILRINEASVIGFVTSMSNSIPTFSLVEKMDSKGIVMNMAFAVSGAFVFGDHLAFTIAFDERYLDGLIVGKLVGGFLAIVVGNLLYRHSNQL